MDRRQRVAIGVTALLAFSGASLAPAAVAQDEPVTLTYLVDDTQNTLDTAQALADAYTAMHPNVTFSIETRPGGADGDNIVKTRLATGEMTDIFWYNSGSLLQALNPAETLVDLSGEPFIANIADSFMPTVSQGDGIYGVPVGTAMGGGILYNKKIYERPRPVRAHDVGRVRGQQRGHQGGRHRASRCDVQGHVDVPAVRAGRLLQRPGSHP